jgi:hypothetical protein
MDSSATSAATTRAATMSAATRIEHRQELNLAAPPAVDVVEVLAPGRGRESTDADPAIEDAIDPSPDNEECIFFENRVKNLSFVPAKVKESTEET